MLVYTILFPLLALASFAPPEAPWSQWQLQSQVDPLEAGLEAQFVRLTLTPEILSELTPKMSDLRVVDDAGTEQPFYQTALDERLQERFYESRILDQGTLPDRHQQLVCDLGEGERISNQIRVETPAREFHYRVQVWGSPDSQQWLLLRDRAYLFHHEDPTASNLEISYPETSYRFLKLLLWLEGDDSLPISAVRVGSVTRQEVPVESQVAQMGQVIQDSDRRTTDLTFSLPNRNQHFNRVRLVVAGDTFRRWAEVAYQDDKQRWVQAGASSVYRFPGEEQREEQLLVPLTDFNRRQARLRIWNDDNPPLEVTGAVFERPPQVLVFRPEPGRGYRLLVGNPDAVSPRYDLDLAVKRLDLLQLPEIRFEPLAPHPGFRPTTTPLPWTERHPALLWLGLAGGGLLLLWLLRGTLQDLNKPRR